MIPLVCTRQRPRTDFPRVCVFTALLSLFVHVPLIYACQRPIDFPRVRVGIHSCAPFVGAGQTPEGSTFLVFTSAFTAAAPCPSFVHANARGVDRVRASVHSRVFTPRPRVYFPRVRIGVHSRAPLSSFRSRFGP